MSHNGPISGWLCILAVSTLTTGAVVHADDKSTVANQDKVVTLPSGGMIKVHDAPDPGKNLHMPAPSDKYDPRNYSLNQTSSMANKSFSADTIATSKSGSSVLPGPNTFATKSFNGLTTADTTTKTAQTKYSTSTSTDYNRTSTQFDKNFATTSSDMAHKSPGFDKTSPDQGRTSSLGSKKSETHESTLPKQYLGPGAQNVKDGSVKENVVIAHVTDIPNRPLTIDEVRGLINHGFKPDLNTAPNESSKALNDPNYQPEASPSAPDLPMPSAADDEKSGILPSPGTLAQPPPENSTPLPQH